MATIIGAILVTAAVLYALMRVTCRQIDRISNMKVATLVTEELDDPAREDAMARMLNETRWQPTMYKRTELACMYRRGQLASWVTLAMCADPNKLETENDGRIALRPDIVLN